MKALIRSLTFRLVAASFTIAAFWAFFASSPATPGSTVSAQTLSNAQVLPKLEKKMLELINDERQARRLPALSADPQMTRVARAHSLDMIKRKYFSHVTPDGRDPFERMIMAGVRYQTAGENLASGLTIEIAHVMLMNSKGHRANILNRDFGRVGIGVVGDAYGLTISQEFRD